MAFSATWHTLVGECEDLPPDATLVAPLSHRGYRVTDVQEHRIVVERVDAEETRPLKRDQFEALFRRIGEADGAFDLDNLPPGAGPYAAVWSLHPRYEIDESAGVIREQESPTSTQVAVAGDLSLYEPRGSCSILVTDVVELGDGSYQQQYREHKQALEADGLLDDEHKQRLPELPQTIGIVTSADSDAREDAITSIHERHPDVDVVVHHAAVQGDQALPTLLEGISALDRDPDVDLLVVTRGGGADTTLRVFNEPGLCRTIFNTETPIVVGIGHERDRTLADEVADHRVMTPTHVGSVIPEKAALLEEHQTVVESLEGAYERLATRRLEETERALDDAFQDPASAILTEADSDLDYALETLARERLTDLDNRLDHAVEALEREAEYEREKEAATAEVEATYERRQRIQRVAIALLVALLVGLTLYVLFVM